MKVKAKMLRKRSFQNLANNNRGLVSADFIFSFAIAAGLSMVLFVLTFTFSMVEIAQYIVFSASRAHAAAHVDQDQQEKMGNDKFKELIDNKVLASLFKNSNWFALTNLDIRGGGPKDKHFNDEYAGYDSNDPRVPFVGARADFEAKVLNIRVPFLGSTAGDDEGYKARLTAFLIREPTQKECMDLQVKMRYRAILELDQRYKGNGTTGALSHVSKYVPMEDNGC